MKITVLYSINLGTLNDPLAKIADDDTIETTESVVKALSEKGFTVEAFDVNDRTIKQLPKIKTDLFFNITEATSSNPNHFIDVANVLESTGIPFTGSCSKSLQLTTNKIAVKDLIKNWVPTAKYFISEQGEIPNNDLKFPMIVKPSCQDCSVGISEKSVVHNQKDLQEQILQNNPSVSKPVLVEEFIDGREFAVAVMGNKRKIQVLPIYELIYSDYFNDKVRIYDYETKWNFSCKRFDEIYCECPAIVNEDLADNVAKICKKVYQLTGCTDYARVDMRISEGGKPYVLEINANPGIGVGDVISEACMAKGIKYGQLLEKIVKLAIDRYYNSETNTVAIASV